MIKLLLPIVLTAVAASVVHETVIPEASVEIDSTGESTPHEDSGSISANNVANNADDDLNEQCGIWLAPSTIKGAGLGMFAGKNFKKDEILLPTGDSVIGIVDLALHNRQQYTEAFLWDEYTWSGRALRLYQEGHNEVNVASAGFGAAVNCFLPILNTEEFNPELKFDGLTRAKDPGAGASTQHHARMSVAKRDIVAGEEFFVSCEYTCREILVSNLCMPVQY